MFQKCIGAIVAIDGAIVDKTIIAGATFVGVNFAGEIVVRLEQLSRSTCLFFMSNIIGAMFAGADESPPRSRPYWMPIPSVRSYKIIIIMCTVYSDKFHHPVQCAQGRKLYLNNI